MNKVQRLEARVRELERQAKCRCVKPCRACYCPQGLDAALAAALRTGAHGHVMTAEGYPVRLLADDTRQARRSSRTPEPLLGLLLYPMGHELAEYWAINGTNNAKRGSKNLVPLDRKRLNEGFYRYGKEVLREVGLLE